MTETLLKHQKTSNFLHIEEKKEKEVAQSQEEKGKFEGTDDNRLIFTLEVSDKIADEIIYRKKEI